MKRPVALRSHWVPASAGMSGAEEIAPKLNVNTAFYDDALQKRPLSIARTKKGPADAGPFRVPASRRDQSWVWLWVSAAEAVPEALQA